MEILVVFESRTESMKFLNLFTDSGFFAQGVNNPREITKNCGMSVKINKKDLQIAYNLLNQYPFKHFFGMFIEENYNNLKHFKRI
ncbi:MAG: DUF3343 domain-containing protein [Clostridia bacterium]